MAENAMTCWRYAHLDNHVTNTPVRTSGTSDIYTDTHVQTRVHIQTHIQPHTLSPALSRTLDDMTRKNYTVTLELSTANAQRTLYAH